MRSAVSRLVAAAAMRLRVPGAGGFNTRGYWHARYARGGTSGDGSHGRMASFKAEVVSSFLREHDVSSAIEFGCGDGHQLSLMTYAKSTGLDVSGAAVIRCMDRFADDPTKRFFVYDPEAYHDPLGVFRADGAVSLDVIYHIVSDATFDLYMTHVCAAASRFLIVYSTDFDGSETPHVRHRAVSEWIRSHRAEFRLLKSVLNPYARTGEQESNAAFFIFERTP